MTSTASRTLIPIELLRRSTRLKHTAATSSIGIVCDAKIKLEEEPKQSIKKRRKLELKKDVTASVPVVEVTPKIEKHTLAKEDRHSAGIKVALSESLDALVADGFIRLNEDELDLERTLMGGQSFRWTKDDRTFASRPVFTGIVQKYVFQLWRSAPSEIAFRVLNKLSRQEEPNLILARQLLEDYFRVDYKLEDLYKTWSMNDEHFALCSKGYKGFRILRQDPLENVFSFICATNNNIKRISQMVENLCKHFGDILENRDEDKQSVYDSYQSFPSVERLAQDDVFDCLRYQLGFGYRAKYISETAKKLLKMSTEAGFKSPREYLLSLRSLDYKETRKQLMQLSGIGRKVADCICLMSMDHLRAVPIDCHIYEIVCRHYMPNLRKERKTLTDNVHDIIGDYFHNLHGPLAGWSTSVLFVGELKHLQSDQKRETTHGRKDNRKACKE